MSPQRRMALLVFLVLVPAVLACSLFSGAGAGTSPTQTEGTPAPAVQEGGSSSGQTACDQTYLPVRKGAHWRYTDTEGETTFTVADVTGNSSQAEAKVEIGVGGSSVTVPWLCDRGGILAALLVGGPTGGNTTEMKITAHSGTLVPAASKLTPGYEWKSSLEADVPDPAQGTSHWTQTGSYRVDSTNPVTVNGQSHDGVQISGTITTDVKFGDLDSGAVPAQMTLTLGRDVGIVEWKITSEDGSTVDMTLVDFTLP